MTKLHLPAVPANEGARLIARHLLREAGKARAGSVDLKPIAAKLGTDAGMLQRIVDGEIEPGLTLGTVLHRAAGVRARDFKRPAVGGWFDAELRAA